MLFTIYGKQHDFLFLNINHLLNYGDEGKTKKHKRYRWKIPPQITLPTLGILVILIITHLFHYPYRYFKYIPSQSHYLFAVNHFVFSLGFNIDTAF